MNLIVLFGQRKCEYDGEYAPETLEIVCDAVMDTNPDWIHDKKAEYIETGEFDAVELVEIFLGEDATKKIYDRLTKNVIVDGSVEG